MGLGLGISKSRPGVGSHAIDGRFFLGGERSLPGGFGTIDIEVISVSHHHRRSCCTELELEVKVAERISVERGGRVLECSFGHGGGSGWLAGCCC